jgi:hypothetical protein
VADNKSAIQPVLAPPTFLSGKLESRVLGGITSITGRSGATTGGGVSDAVTGAAGSLGTLIAGITGTEQNTSNGTLQDSRIADAPAPSSGLTFAAPEASAAGGTTGYSPILTPLIAPVTPVIAPGPTIGLLGAWSSSSSPFIGEGGGAFVFPSALVLNGSGNLIALNVPSGTLTTDGATLGITGSASLAPVDTGTGSSVNAHWGRWPSGTVIDDGGSLVSTIPGGAHFLYGDLAPPDVVAAKTGTFLLSQVGGTTPTNNFGFTSASAYPSITLDFTAKTGTVSAFGWAFGGSGDTWSLSSTSGNIVIASGQGAGFMANGSGSCSGTFCGTSAATYNVNGVFLGAQGNHLGVSINMHTTSGSGSAMGVRLYTCAPSC